MSARFDQLDGFGKGSAFGKLVRHRCWPRLKLATRLEFGISRSIRLLRSRIPRILQIQIYVGQTFAQSPS
jgi:hypothetical protein